MIKIGDINKLIVLRKTDIGYILTDKVDEVFLHNNETNNRLLQEGDNVEAFLYYDFKGRLAATLEKPFLTVNSQEFLKVVEVKRNLGVFLDMGINKDLLLSKEDLPLDLKLWPEVGDYIYSSLKVKGKLVAKKVSRGEIEMLEAVNYQEKEEVIGYVLRVSKDGLNILSKERVMIFVHSSMYKGVYRIGQEVNVTLLKHTDKGWNGSLILQKEDAIYEDSNMILSYLIRNNGQMSLTSNSSPEEIKEFFDLSKKAFKRAIGNLYKERKILFEEDKTILVKR